MLASSSWVCLTLHSPCAGNVFNMSSLVTAFGSTEYPTTEGLNPTTTANTMAAWVKTYGLDGLDVGEQLWSHNAKFPDYSDKFVWLSV